MNGLPTEMVNRWQDRPEPAPGQGLIYWHMLAGDIPGAAAMARKAQARLAGFSGLHLTPLKWLHMTALIAGPSGEIDAGQVREMADAAAARLARVPPISVTLGKILYHPEAIMLAARPAVALKPVREAAEEATRQVTGSPGRSGSNLATWTPHITIAYSTARQPAAPLISALGSTLPEREIQISAVSLVHQQGPERDWDWHPMATIQLRPVQARPITSASQLTELRQRGDVRQPSQPARA